MDLNQVEHFINRNKVTSRLVLPSVGGIGNAFPALRAKAHDDKKKLIWVGAGNPVSGAQAYEVYGSFVRDIIPTPDGKKLRLHVDDEFPEQAIDFEVIDPKDSATLEAHGNAHDIFDDANDDLAAEMEAKLQNTPDYPAPQLKEHNKFVRWAELTQQGVRPRGVILLTPDKKKLHAVGFPTFEREAAHWGKLEDVSEDTLGELASRAGRSTVISIPETIHSEGWEDAPLRALYKYGADYYEKTGRTAFR